MSYLPHDARVIEAGQDLEGILEALPNNSGVYLGPGTHTVANPIDLNGKSGIHIYGGPDALIDHTAVSGDLFNITNCTDITFEGFKIRSATDDNIFDLLAGTIERIKWIDIDFEGTNVVDRPIFIYSDTTPNVTDILVDGCRAHGSVQTFVFITADVAATIRHLRIVNCIVEGPTIAPLSPLIRLDADDPQFISCVVIANNILEGGSTALSIFDTQCATLEGNICKNQTSDNFSFGSDVINMTIQDNIFYAAGVDGIDDSNSSGSHHAICGNVITTPGDRCFHIAADRVTVQQNICYNPTNEPLEVENGTVNIVFKNNVCIGGGTASINSDGADDAIYDGNILSGNSGNGIDVGDNTHNRLSIVNNIIRDNGGTDGIEIATAGNPIDSVISGNIVYDNDDRGIKVQSATRMVISGNVITLSQLSAIRFETGTISGVTVRGNVLYDNTANSMVDVLNGTISSITFVGNVQYSAGDYGYYIAGASVSNLHIESDLIDSPANSGVYCTATVGDYLEVVGCLIYNPVGGGSSGIDMTNGGIEHLLISGCLIYDAGQDGIGVRNQYVSIVGCQVYDCDDAGIWCDIQGNQGSLLVAFCMAIDNGTGAVDGGIMINGAAANFTDNWNIKGCSSLDNFDDGFNVTYGREGAVVGCRAGGNGGDGIFEDANSDQNLYVENHLRGNTGAAENYNGTNRTNANNKV